MCPSRSASSPAQASTVPLSTAIGGRRPTKPTTPSSTNPSASPPNSAFDARSERNLATLLPEAQKAARRFLTKAIAAGHDVRILSGTRSYAEQAALFRKGRWGNPGPRVTNARPGQSLHNHGVAWDVGVFKNGQYQTAQAPYVAVAKYHDPETTEWGGSWKTFKDTPHYQLRHYVKL
ncbi:MAG: M15 family metallopeptidase [Rhodothermales bacterium]|nr:M15 family metallopeptidase [Rhodothermales bacterium]